MIIIIGSHTFTSAQEQIVFSSPFLQTNDTVLIFTPFGYEAGNRNPTLFLLHGWSGDYSNWNNRVPLQEVSDKYGFIIVCPDGFYNSWYLNSSNPKGMQWRHFFDQELYPEVQKRYHTTPDLCFITGLSMGGHGALNIFIDDPSRFRSAGSMSGVMDLRKTSLSATEVAKVLGDFTPDNEYFDSESVINRIDQLQVSNKVQDSETTYKNNYLLVISCGYEDIYSIHSEELSQKCRNLEIPHTLLLTPGNHSWKYWEFALDLHITLFSKMLKGDNLGY